MDTLSEVVRSLRNVLFLEMVDEIAGK